MGGGAWLRCGWRRARSTCARVGRRVPARRPAMAMQARKSKPAWLPQREEWRKRGGRAGEGTDTATFLVAFTPRSLNRVCHWRPKPRLGEYVIALYRLASQRHAVPAPNLATLGLTVF